MGASGNFSPNGRMHMNEWRIIKAYGNAQLDMPVQTCLAVLTILGVGAMSIFIEPRLSLLIIIVVVLSQYGIFRKLIAKINELQPDVVPRPFKMSLDSENPKNYGGIILPIRNEGKSPARNIHIKMTHKDRIFPSEYASLTPDDGIVCLKLGWFSVGPSNSRERIQKMESDDETVRLECRFSDPSGVDYSTYWECEWRSIDSSQPKTSNPVVGSLWRKSLTI